MKPSKTLALIQSLFLALGAMQASATTLFWDVNGATTPCGGTGNWETTANAFWATACDTAGAVWVNANGDSARLTVASVPTLTAPITVNNIQVDVSGITFGNAAVVANRFTFSGASAGVNCNHASGATTLTAPYTGSLFTKTGPG